MLSRTLAAFTLCAAVVFAGDPAAGPSAEDAKAKVDALKAAKDAEGKKKAIADAATCPHALVAAALGTMLMDLGFPDVCVAAADALGSMKGLADASRALTTAIGATAKNADVQKAIFTALGKVNSAAGVPAIKDFLAKRVPLKDEKDSAVTCAAVSALGEIKWKASVEVLLELYKKQVGIGMGCSAGIQGPLYSAITGGLKTLTGQTFNSMPGEAELWWRKNKDTFKDDMTKK